MVAVWSLSSRKRKIDKSDKITRLEMAQPETAAGAQPSHEVQGSLTDEYGRQELQAGPVSKTAGRPELDVP